MSTKKEGALTIEKKDFFGKLPTYLIADMSFSDRTMAAALYLESKPDGWVCHPSDIRKRFKWGRHTWLKVSKELKLYGLLHETKTMEGTTLRFGVNWVGGTHKANIESQPPAKAVDNPTNPPSDFRTVRKADVGKSNPLDKKDRNKEISINKQTTPVVVDKLLLQAKELLPNARGPHMKALISEYGSEKIQEKLNMLKDAKNIEDPDGWFVAALKNDWHPKSKKLGQLASYPVPSVEETETYLKEIWALKRKFDEPKMKERGLL